MSQSFDPNMVYDTEDFFNLDGYLTGRQGIRQVDYSEAIEEELKALGLWYQLGKKCSCVGGGRTIKFRLLVMIEE